MADPAPDPGKAIAKPNKRASQEHKVASSGKKQTKGKKKTSAVALQLNDLVPTVKEYTTADLRRLKAEAIARRRNNATTGCGQLMVVDENDSASWIAGYVGFHDSNVLRNFLWSDGKLQPVLGPCGRPSIRVPFPHLHVTNA
jgi:hypothetical protein